ncbi:MAG: chorismate lyase [Pseudomonadota bacterium]|nr:chorismate lyase [Pseudomonadota bacterium]
MAGGLSATRVPLSSSARDPLIHDWLTHTQSLTARLRRRSRCFAVQVLYQGRVPLRGIERRLLGAAAVAHAREVLLLADGVPVVWARTVLAPSALRGAWRFLGRLGTRPLGGRLFTDPGITRTRFAFLPMRRLQARRAPPSVPLAGRRALLLRGGQAALLTEVLLPALRAVDGGDFRRAPGSPMQKGPQPLGRGPSGTR